MKPMASPGTRARSAGIWVAAAGWAALFSLASCGCWSSRCAASSAPAASAVKVTNSTIHIFTLVSNMVSNTPSAREAASAETVPARAWPVADSRAARTLD